MEASLVVLKTPLIQKQEVKKRVIHNIQMTVDHHHRHLIDIGQGRVALTNGDNQNLVILGGGRAHQVNTLVVAEAAVRKKKNKKTQ